MATRAGVRLSELVASLSLAIDLGLGQPQEHVLRQTVIASRLAEVAGLSDEERAATFYVSLLAWVGCVADSHEMSRWFGDDTEIRAASYEVDRAGIPMLRFLLGQLASGGSSFQRVSMVGRFVTGGMKEVMNSLAGHCQTTADIADRLGIVPQVMRALPQVLERWDGKGGPNGVKGEQLEPVIRVAHIANDAEVICRLAGVQAALDMLRERSGRQFDPKLVELSRRHADEIFGGLDDVDAWRDVIEGCATLDRKMSDEQLVMALEALADYGDVKSPWFIGHSRAVAALVADAAKAMRLPVADAELARRAALVCRLGMIGVSSGIWGKDGALTTSEFERVRTVPYLTERILSRQPQLAKIGAVAAMFHERSDGSGYPRGLSGAAIPRTARLLAAAEMYQALREVRPQRPAYSAERAKSLLLEEADAGRLDAAAVNAVLRASGHRVRREPNLVAGLTAREAEVLALLVRGLSNKEIAASLSLSKSTVGTHIEHIFAKSGVTTRGAAAMFAMRHGLVDAVAEESGI
jgi:HD-GYP domain-containing protein (c-di-GMP phosphodiesterase class II)